MAESTVVEVRLSGEALSFVRSMVESGEAASESDAVSELIELEAEEYRRIVREEVMAAYRESIEAPETAIPIDEVWRNLGRPLHDGSKEI